MLLDDAGSAGAALKPIDIEALLRWAYCEELPKAVEREVGGGGPGAPRRGWAKVESYVQLLTVIDVNWFGVVPNLAAEGEPHDDAIAVYDAVCALDALELDVPDAAEWQPFDDLGDLGPEGVAAAGRALASMIVPGVDDKPRLKRAPRRLIEKHAILGGHPDWECEQPVRRYVRTPNGMDRWFMLTPVTQADGTVRDVEVDGFDGKARRPRADAYRKMELHPDPVEALICRGEYEVWRAALDVLVEDLAGVLTAHRLTPCTRAWRPWEDGARAHEPRILADLGGRFGAARAKWARIKM
jgi:hypothetical protein